MMRSSLSLTWRIALAGLIALAIVGCGSSGKGSGAKDTGVKDSSAKSSSTKRGGGYYLDDGPDANPPSKLDAIPDAVPRIEPYASGNNKPYRVFGKRYRPDSSGQPYKVRGRASWYGKKFHGNSTANGERYDMYAMTAAHTTLPLPSYVRVTSMVNGKTVVLRINDRGPFHSNRVIDVSYVAAYKLGLIGPGSGEVVVEKITHDEIRKGVTPTQAATPVLNIYPIAAAPSANAATSAPMALPALTASSIAPTSSGPLPPLVATASPAASSGGVFLQLGAFSQEGNAQALATRVQGEVPGQQVLTQTDPSGALFRVKVGPYTERQTAIDAAQDLYRRLGIMPTIAP